jgi:hypothetical protein
MNDTGETQDKYPTTPYPRVIAAGVLLLVVCSIKKYPKTVAP